MAKRYGIKGVPVLRATPGLPAARGGIKGITRNRYGAAVMGDVIIGIEEHVIDNYDDLLSALESFPAR